MEPADPERGVGASRRDAAILATDEARILVVDWRATNACNASLDDLFEGARIFGGGFPPELDTAQRYSGAPTATVRLAPLVNKTHPVALGLTTDDGAAERVAPGSRDAVTAAKVG